MDRELQLTTLLQQVDAVEREMRELRWSPRRIKRDLVVLAVVPTSLALSHAPWPIWLAGAGVLVSGKAFELIRATVTMRRLRQVRAHLLEGTDRREAGEVRVDDDGAPHF